MTEVQPQQAYEYALYQERQGNWQGAFETLVALQQRFPNYADVVPRLNNYSQRGFRYIGNHGYTGSTWQPRKAGGIALFFYHNFALFAVHVLSIILFILFSNGANYLNWNVNWADLAWVKGGFAIAVVGVYFAIIPAAIFSSIFFNALWINKLVDSVGRWNKILLISFAVMVSGLLILFGLDYLTYQNRPAECHEGLGCSLSYGIFSGLMSLFLILEASILLLYTLINAVVFTNKKLPASTSNSGLQNLKPPVAVRISVLRAVLIAFFLILVVVLLAVWYLYGFGTKSDYLRY